MKGRGRKGEGEGGEVKEEGGGEGKEEGGRGTGRRDG